MNEKFKKIKQELIKTKKSILNKYRTLHQSKLDEDELLKNKYKPLTEPINQIVSIVQKSSEIENKTNLKKDENNDEKNKSNLDEYRDILENQPIIKIKKLNPKLLPQSSFFSYLDLIDTNGSDKIYGVKKDVTNGKYKLGQCTFSISPSTNEILINNEPYKMTDGLMNLIFLNKPLSFNQFELNAYKKILEKTNVHKKNAVTGELKKNNSYKYNNIIKPLFTDGGKMKMLYKIHKNNNIDYKYWDDPNELVERLHLLISSMSAGHNNHQNEIIEIIEELREANIIL